MTLQAALQRVIEHREIFHDEMVSLMRQIMGGGLARLIMAIITGLRVKGNGGRNCRRRFGDARNCPLKVQVADPSRLVDTCNRRRWCHTSIFPLPPCSLPPPLGAWLPKHGGRSVSSQSGGADVLEALGANINQARAGGRVHR